MITSSKIAVVDVPTFCFFKPLSPKKVSGVPSTLYRAMATCEFDKTPLKCGKVQHLVKREEPNNNNFPVSLLDERASPRVIAYVV